MQENFKVIEYVTRQGSEYVQLIDTFTDTVYFIPEEDGFNGLDEVLVKKLVLKVNRQCIVIGRQGDVIGAFETDVDDMWVYVDAKTKGVTKLHTDDLPLAERKFFQNHFGR